MNYECNAWMCLPCMEVAGAAQETMWSAASAHNGQVTSAAATNPGPGARHAPSALWNVNAVRPEDVWPNTNWPRNSVMNVPAGTFLAGKIEETQAETEPSKRCISLDTLP